MAFEGLQERLQGIFKKISGQGKLTEANMDEMLKEIRMALLEADVNFKVVKHFVNDVKEKALGQKVVSSLTASQMVVKIVKEELVELFGEETKPLNMASHGVSTILMCGLNGSGKTTLINLLMRFFDIKEGDGSIEIDNQDIRDITQESLRNNISYIPQDPILFHRTIKENIKYGNLKATDEEIIDAVKKASCYDFIMELENGFDTLVGERGVKLSGGQRQRIAIARAILKNSPILILDEATSALDSITEKEIQTALSNLMQNKTVIAIAHRLSTLNNMDRIIVLDKGKIVEDGKKEELLKIENGLFKKMWDMQKDGIIG